MKALAEDLSWRGTIPAVIAGAVTGVVVVILSLSFAVLIFTGSLAAHVGSAIGMVLFTGVMVGGIAAFTSSYAGTIAFPQDKIAPILALMASLIVAELPPDTPSEEVFATVVAALILATLLTGGFLVALGSYKLGGLIRFIPYPVIGGFLAGTGWLLVRGAFRVMTGHALTAENLHHLIEPGAVIRWLPGLAFALVLLFVMRRYKHVLTMPLLLAAGIAVFHLARTGLGIGNEQAEAEGFLLGHLPAEAAWKPTGMLSFFDAHWSVLIDQVGTLATILLISGIGVLLNSSALEVAANQDIDLNRELKVAGIANLASGLGGGIIGFHTLSLSSLVLKMGVRSRIVGVVSALACLAMLIAGTSGLALFPKAILGGLLMFLGFGFLVEWLYDSYRRMSKSDYAIVVMIVGIVGAFGYLQGAAAGIVACVVLFVVNYSRVSVAKHELTGEDLQSNVDRPAGEARLLREHGKRLFILNLQGYMFFGTANKLLTRITARCAELAENVDSVRFVVFDFRRVTGIDSSGTMSFVKLRQLAEKKHLILVFAHLSDDLRFLMEQAGFVGVSGPTYRLMPDLDYAVEWCENQVLVQLAVENIVALPSFVGRLAEDVDDPRIIERLMRYLEPRREEAGVVLLRQDDPAHDLFIVETGTVTARLTDETGHSIRLRTMHAGTVVGEMGMYLGETRSASVVTETPCTLYRLSETALERMQGEAPEVAAAFHRFMARRLAERLRHTDQMVKALMD